METKVTSTSRSLSNGNKIPWIGFGTGTALYGKDVSEDVTAALAAGYTHIDAAEVYANEESVGVALHKHLTGPSAPGRDSIFVTTKFALFSGLEPGETVRDRLSASLKKLQLDYVDLYLIHSPVVHGDKLKGIWKQMEGVKKEGLARNIGVSNFRIKDLDEIIADADVIPVVNQIEFNPYVLKASEPLFAFHKKHGILTTSYGGLLPLHKAKGGSLDSVFPAIRERYSKDLGIDISDEQILTKWTTAKGGLPITTTSRKERLTSMLKVAELPDLKQSEVDQIDAAGSKEHRRFYGKHMDDV